MKRIRSKRMVAVTVTYLEMTSPAQRAAAPGWSEPVDIRRAERPSAAFYRHLYDTVGARWGWYERRLLSDEALTAIVHDPLVEIFVPRLRGGPAGYVELDRRVADAVQIAYFGLMPEHIGLGLGPALLGWTLDRAWSYRPGRVWLHTCSLDHPKALNTYLRAGFAVYDRRVVSVARDLLDLARRRPGHLAPPAVSRRTGLA